MAWLVPPGDPAPPAGDERTNAVKASPDMSSDDPETMTDSLNMDDLPTANLAQAKTRDSATRRIDSANHSFDDSGVHPSEDEDFSLFADVQPQMPRLAAPDSINELPPRTYEREESSGIRIGQVLLWVILSAALGGLIAFLINT